MESFDLGRLQEWLLQIVFIFVLFQCVVFGIAWRNLSKQVSWHIYTNAWASILTVIGIFGTFFGIFIGLLAFNIEDIPGSIPGLLGGLKLAFLTSLVGILSAIILKWKGLGQIQEGSDPRQETIDEFVGALKKALESVETSGERELSSKLDALRNTIETDGKTTQNVLQDTRKDLTDIQSKAFEQLKTLTTTVSDEHSQLRKDREAIRDVLADTKNELTGGQAKILGQLQTLTSTISDKSDLIITSQANEGSETRKTLANMQSELTGRQNKAFIQLRELTKTVSYEHSQLRKEFEHFSKNVAESITELATKELISSLTKVIDQFNTQLSTQFGDNFKHLNEAVGKTVEWQKQYRQDMDTLADEFRIAAESIEKSRDSLITIADKSGNIVTIATDLEPILHTLNDQLGAFSNLSDKANDAFPLIEKRLDDLTTEFSDAVQTAITESQAQSKKLKTQYDEFQKVIAGLDDFTKQVGGVTENTSKIIKDLQASIDFQEQALKNSASYVTKMQTSLEAQLTASISKLSTGLAALSEKFVEDYTPLTDSLRDVLAIAEGVLPRQPRN